MGSRLCPRALIRWQTDRRPRLDRIDAQNAALGTAAPPDPQLVDENLRGFVMLLAAHLQGFCRDLHSECIQVATITVPAPVQYMFQTLAEQGRELSRANANYASIKADFERFAFDLTAALTADPALPAAALVANQGCITRVNLLSAWRNYAAHHNPNPPAAGGSLTLTAVQDWKGACDRLAAELDRVMYNRLMALTGVAPW